MFGSVVRSKYKIVIKRNPTISFTHEVFMFISLNHLFLLAPILVGNLVVFYEIYQAKKIIARLLKEIDRFSYLEKEIKSLEDRMFGLENVTIRSLDSAITHTRMDVQLIKEKIFLKKNEDGQC